MSVNDSYYDDAPEGAAQPASDQPHEGDDSKTALLPKSLFGHELKPGDKCDIEVVAVHEDDYAVKGCSGESDDKVKVSDAPDEGSAPPPEGSMSSLLQD